VLKNRLAYIVVVIVLFQLVYIYEHNMTYAAFYAALMLPLISLAATLVLRRKLVISEELSAYEVVKGGRVRYIFTLNNGSFLLCTNVHVSFGTSSPALEADADDGSFSVLPFKSRSVSFDVTTKYRGVYSVGAESITLYDFLGLFKFRQGYAGGVEFVVNPSVKPVSGLPMLAAVQDTAEARSFMQDENYSIISDLRKYQPTDGYKKIHWKLSAKKGELISKNFQITQRTSVSLVFDSSAVKGLHGEDAMKREDLMVEALVSVMSEVSGQSCPVELRIMGKDERGAQTGAFEYLYKVAAGIRFADYGRFDDYFANIVRMQSEASGMVLFLQHITDSTAAAIKTLVFFGCNVVVFAPAEDASEKDGIAKLEEMGVLCISYEE